MKHDGPVDDLHDPTHFMPVGTRGVLLLATLTLLATFLANAPWVWSLCERTADYALIVLQTARAQNFDALEGPYSRFGFRHPAPTYFYWYALTTPLFGGTDTLFGAVSGAQYLLNAMLLLSAVWWFLRLSYSPKAASLFFLIALAAGIFEGQDFFFDPWGPRSVVIPLLLTVLTLTALGRGMLSALFPCTVGIILACSNHASALVIVAPLALLAFFKFLRHHRQHRKPFTRTECWSMGGAAAILLLALIPPTLEAMLAPGAGNLGKILAFASAPSHEPHPLRALLQGAALQLAGPFGIRETANAAITVALILVVPCALLFRPRFPLRDLVALAASAIVLGILSIIKVPGNLHSYLFLPLLAPSIILIASSLSILFEGPGRLARIFYPLCACVACLLILYSRQPPRSCGGKYEALLSSLTPRQDESIMVSPPSARDWAPFAMLVSLLYRKGSAPCVEPQWGFMFTDALVCKARPTRSLVIGTRKSFSGELSTHALLKGDLVALERRGN